MQHVIGHTDALALFVAAGNLEDRGLGLGIDRHKIVLIEYPHAAILGDLGQMAREKGHAKDHRRMDIVGDIDLVADAAPPQIVDGQINDLLRRAGAFERQRRLGEYGLVTRLERLDAVPCVGDVLGRIVAALYAVRAYETELGF